MISYFFCLFLILKHYTDNIIALLNIKSKYIKTHLFLYLNNKISVNINIIKSNKKESIKKVINICL